MKKEIFLLLVMSVILWNACDDDDHLTPTEGLESAYILPQGSHDYDTKIVDWNKRCGFFILYKFEPKDIYWGQTDWLEAIETDERWTNGILGRQADEAYVGQQLEFVEKHFLSFYSDSTLRRLMPLKFLFCQGLQRVFNAEFVTFTDLHLASSIDMLAINYGDEQIDNLDAHEETLFRDSLHVTLLWRAIESGKIQIPSAFTELSDYGEYVSKYTMYEEGFIGEDSQVATLERDLKCYVQAIVTTSYEELMAEPEGNDFSYKGILHPSKDVNTLVKQKYDILIDYFKKQYNIDLQKIGDEEL